MYESFYGLKAKPFQLNPDPSFYFDSKQHRRATAYLEYGLHQNQGFVVVTGEVGAGKTTIVRGLLESLDEKKIVAAQLVTTQLDADDILKMVAAAFGVRVKDVAKADLLLHIEAQLLAVVRRGQRCLLVVDEAQNLTSRAVEELRMLSNFQFQSHALLQTFLVGQPEFRAIMLSAEMEQLRQRVIAACHIGPLDAEETSGYIQHRLRCAGATDFSIFADECYSAVYLATGGIPRRINALCDRLLLAGFLGGTKVLGKADVDAVVVEMNYLASSRASLDESHGVSGPHAISDEFAMHSGGKIGTDLQALEDSEVFVKLAEGERLRGQIARIERSLLRLEKTTSLTLKAMQRLIDSVRETPGSPPTGEG